MKLTIQERLILVNQYRILKEACPKLPESCANGTYDNIITALEEGYEGQYDSLVKDFHKESFSSEKCKFVLDVLGMYSDFYYVSKQTSFSTLKPNNILFLGFHKNDEHRYLSYTEYLIDNLGLFPELKETSKGKYDSIIYPRVEKYEKMLTKFNQYGSSKLTEGIISEILSIE